MRMRGWGALALLTSGVAHAQDATVPEASPAVVPEVVPEVAPAEATPQAVVAPVVANDEVLDARLRALEHQVDLALGDSASSRGPADLPPALGSNVHGYAAGGIVGWSKEQPFGVEVGELVFGYEARISRTATVHADVAFQDGSQNAMEFVDRAEFDVGVSEHMTLRVGKLYTPLGYWNANVPIESFDVVTRGRPEFLTRESAAFATRQGGLDLSGRYVLGSSQLGWRLGGGNGRSYDLNSTATFLDTAPGKSGWAALWVQSPGGLQVGASGMYDPIRPAPGTLAGPGIVTTSIDEFVLTAHLALLRPHTELIGEAFVILHGESNEPMVFNRNAYLQFSHRMRALTPYARVEYVEQWAEDPVYILQQDTHSSLNALVGARRDLGAHFAVKGEVIGEQAVSYGDGPSAASLRIGAALQLAATF